MQSLEKQKKIDDLKKQQDVIASNSLLQRYVKDGIEIDVLERWADKTPHHPITASIITNVKALDRANNDILGLALGDDCNNADVLAYLLDAFFEWVDKQEINRAQPTSCTTPQGADSHPPQDQQAV